jgi:hypothetical protein
MKEPNPMDKKFSGIAGYATVDVEGRQGIKIPDGNFIPFLNGEHLVSLPIQDEPEKITISKFIEFGKGRMISLERWIAEQQGIKLQSKELSEEEKKLLTLGNIVKEATRFTKHIIFDGIPIGRITINDSNYNPDSVEYVEIKPKYRGKGIIKEVFRMINKELNKQGRVLRSDGCGITSPRARQMWESLVRSGEAEVVSIDHPYALDCYKFKNSDNIKT